MLTLIIVFIHRKDMAEATNNTISNRNTTVIYPANHIESV